MRVKRPGDLGDRELSWVLFEDEGQDELLVFGVLDGEVGKAALGATHRVLASHEELLPPCG